MDKVQASEGTGDVVAMTQKGKSQVDKAWGNESTGDADARMENVKYSLSSCPAPLKDI